MTSNTLEFIWSFLMPLSFSFLVAITVVCFLISSLLLARSVLTVRKSPDEKLRKRVYGATIFGAVLFAAILTLTILSYSIDLGELAVIVPILGLFLIVVGIACFSVAVPKKDPEVAEDSKEDASAKVEELKRLKELVDSGIITEEEFEKKKNSIMGEEK